MPIGYLELLAARFADIPGGQLSLPLPGAPAVALAYAGLAAASAVIVRRASRLGPRAEEAAALCRRRPRLQRQAAAAAALTLVCLATVAVLRGPGPPGELTVRFLDVGQGDATLVQHPDGTALLFDGGPPEGGVARLLRKAGVRRLGLVVATHASRDHHGGLADVLARYPVDVLLTAATARPIGTSAPSSPGRPGAVSGPSPHWHPCACERAASRSTSCHRRLGRPDLRPRIPTRARWWRW